MQFPFPDAGRQVNAAFGQERTMYLGRNRHGHCTGLEVLQSCGMVVLKPITGRGTNGGCYIELPGDPETLQAIGDHIASLGFQLECDRQENVDDAA